VLVLLLLFFLSLSNTSLGGIVVICDNLYQYFTSILHERHWLTLFSSRYFLEQVGFFFAALTPYYLRVFFGWNIGHWLIGQLKYVAASGNPHHTTPYHSFLSVIILDLFMLSQLIAHLVVSICEMSPEV
jgi:hypothetical protein